MSSWAEKISRCEIFGVEPDFKEGAKRDLLINKKSTIPLFLWHKRRKEKAWQKENAVIMGLLAPNPRKFFEKNLTKNFQALVQCEHCAFNGRAQKLWQKNKSPVSKFLKDGVRGRKAFLKKFSSPHKNIKFHNPAFSLAQEAQRKSLAKRKRRFYGRCPNPQAFEKAWPKLSHSGVVRTLCV